MLMYFLNVSFIIELFVLLSSVPEESLSKVVQQQLKPSSQSIDKDRITLSDTRFMSALMGFIDTDKTALLHNLNLF